MKKITIVLALFLLVGLVSAFAQNSFSYDISKFPVTRNAEAFTKNYDDFFIPLPEVAEDLSRYRNVIVRAKAYDANGELITRGHQKAMVTILVDSSQWHAGNKDAPEIRRDGHRNHIVKSFNVSNKDNLPGSDAISSNSGERASNRGANPTGILFQNSSTDVAFIEVEEITFLRPR